jgi:cation:H+ antiporter
MAILMTIAGCALLLMGGEVLVRGAVALSLKLGVSPMLVGMTVVAFCTSSPELVVSVQAALDGHPDVALGNVVGSNIANVGLVLGLTALILPIVASPAKIRRDVALMVGASLALAALALTGAIGRSAGIAMLGALVAYVAVAYVSERRQEPGHDWHGEGADEFTDVQPSTIVALVMLIGGVAALLVGANWLVDGATEIAVGLGLPEAVVALTLVALGTSLPELATSLIAARRGHTDVAVGNVIGSNAFNILLILGTTAVISPLTVSERMARVDIPIMLGFTLVAAVALAVRGRVSRLLGGTLVVAYVAYVVVLYV